MKTTYTTMAILGLALLSQNAAAKLGANRSTNQLENNIEINIEAEIINHINMMIGNVQVPTIKTDVAKQLDISTIQLHTNELVQNVAEKLPDFKFKVIIAD